MKQERLLSAESLTKPNAVSPARLAQRWGVSRQTIYNMFADGQLHSFKVRNSRLISLTEVERIERGDS